MASLRGTWRFPLPTCASGTTIQAVGSDGTVTCRLRALNPVSGSARWIAPASAALVTIDRTRSTGRHSSLTIGADGLPIISYWDVNHGVKVVQYSNAVCPPNVRRR